MGDSVPPAGGAGATDPWGDLVPTLVDRLAAALGAPDAPADPAAIAGLLEFTESPDWELALPLHRFARARKLAPPLLATSVATSLGPVDGIVESVAVGPYVNFRVDRPRLTRRTLDLVFARGSAFGGGTPSDQRVCVEHTSANPNGPFHIGRIRNALIGDSLARVLRAVGFPVRTEYYVDDLGRQAAMVTWIWSRPTSEWPPEIRASLDGADPATEKADRYLGRPYPAVNEYLKTHPDADAEVQALAKRLETGDAGGTHRATIERILAGMIASLDRIGVRFDRFTWESELLADGSVAAVVERLARAPHATVEPNGAGAIDATAYGLPQESAKIIVTRADGSSLYVTRDVAYHLRKFAAYDRVIDVLGANHLLHGKVLDALLAEIGAPGRPEYVLYQYITTGEGGGMSTRRGTAVHLDDLLDEAVERAREEVRVRRNDLTAPEVEAVARSVAAGAVRYHILRVAADKTVTFRWEDALSFEGRSGPFVQYAYARASSLLRKAEVAGPPTDWAPERLTTPAEWTLVRRIAQLPRLLAYVARSAHVHAVAGYAHQLAEEFNRFYQDVPVLSAGEERSSRIALVAAARQTLGNTLDAIGVERLERM